MPQRLAGIMSLLAFVFCLIVGGFGAENTLSTVLYRALIAMAGTFVVAFIIGMMASKMIAENIAAMPSPGPPSGPDSANSARSPEKTEEVFEVK